LVSVHNINYDDNNLSKPGYECNRVCDPARMIDRWWGFLKVLNVTCDLSLVVRTE